MPYYEAMTTLTITAKGQVTLKRDLLQHLGVGPGDQVVVDMQPDGCVRLRAAPAGNVEALFGLLKRPDQPCLSIDEISEIASDGWAKRG